MPRDSNHLNIVRAAALSGFETLVRDLGGDAATILRSCALDIEDLDDPERYIPYRNVALAVEEAARLLQVRDFGLLLCAMQDVNSLGLLALVIQSASSVREGVLLGAKHVYFHNPALGYRNFMDSGEGLECVEVFQRLTALPSLPQVTEICVAYLCRIVGMLSDGTLRPAAIHFRHAPVGADTQYRRHLGQTPRFNAAFDGISVDPLAWRRPIPSRNQLLQQFVERFLVGSSLPREQSVSDQASNVLRSLVRAGMADLGTVASAMGQHPRTLQRRLRAEGAVFEELRDAARKTWARQLLVQPGLSLIHIAHLLGFADQSVLTRACQRWFGAAPKRLRQDATAPRALSTS
ncbi:AraC family transcriptional regulator [Bradyrhizobium sp. Pear76]|uniref:AraC family transcriptional regulator n=1 Tax=Bradyrhizobium oropedii TaxID=1571201 RepID=UPI001E2F141B|nr:AraC family transcriptional regulator [Bradyrhizobium oropedii]MCC8961357.1 AraC family transcriptional regulator [Bradyrhizobium oropedii]